MRRTALGALFFGWLYGVPFLLIVGLLRWWSPSTFATDAAADHFATVTGHYLIAALLLNGVVPLAGSLLAKLSRDPFWSRHFAGALVGMVFVYVLFWALTERAVRPLLGPESPTPAPTVTQCIPVSGRHGCPGG
jgi:hypothetical protein